MMKCVKIIVAYFVCLCVLLGFSVFSRYQPSFPIKGFIDATIIQGYPDINTTHDKLLGGLLSSDFDSHSCLSRDQSAFYHKTSPYKPSPYLISKLRNYETLHKRCGPNSQLYKTAVESNRTTDCKYMVWVACSGLGNRMITLTSAFLYALLTDRVLLVDRRKDMPGLFCEPFPGSVWSLPSDFPVLNQFNRFNKAYEFSYGNLLRKNSINASLPQSFLYIHLAHDYSVFDQRFFCDEDQALISKIPWLVLKTDNYFVPALFSSKEFEHELNKLFPEKDTVFHHLGRYLFHPSDQVWGLVTRFYDSYLARADERVGIQVRNFDTKTGASNYQYVIDQILACTQKEKILPETNSDRINITETTPKHKAVIVTSLASIYSEHLKNLYWENTTVDGDTVAVYQPSHEEYQQTDKQLHDKKALSEMYLLSLSDVLVTSGWSTFGYVAQGLGGLRPWILYKPENQMTPDPACVRAMSMEPCFHSPPVHKCGGGGVISNVKQCEDRDLGVKLVGDHVDR